MEVWIEELAGDVRDMQGGSVGVVRDIAWRNAKMGAVLGDV
jgi:hypothetical protein